MLYMPCSQGFFITVFLGALSAGAICEHEHQPSTIFVQKFNFLSLVLRKYYLTKMCYLGHIAPTSFNFEPGSNLNLNLV